MAFKMKDILTNRNTTSGIEVRPLAEAGDDWLAYLNEDPSADICHHHAWGSIFAETFGYDSLLVAHRDQGRIDGGVPIILFDQPITGKAMISMPYLNYGGVLGRTEEIKQEIVNTCRMVLGKLGGSYLELRHAGWTLGSAADRTIQNRVAFRLDINRPAKEIFDDLKKQLRTRLRKASDQGLESYQGRERLNDFYHLFAQAMREHGTPVMPRRFFANVLSHLGNHAQFMLAYKGTRPVGGKLMLTFKNRATMTWGCYPNRYKHLLANYYLTWELIQQLAGGPIQVIDFGRSAPGSGGYIYKSNWQGQEIPIHVDYIASAPDKIPHLKPDNVKFRLAIATWKKLPLLVTKIVGPRLARYFP
jgi:FemAB-related protein (PEP-CTERM system-associated)